MSRRQFVRTMAGAGGWLTIFSLKGSAVAQGPGGVSRIGPPASGKIPVAFLTSDGANVIDTAGPWEVFQDVHVHGRGPTHDDMMPFRLFTVAETRRPVRLTGGLAVTPDYSVDDAPSPRVIVVPAMRPSPRVLDWLKRSSQTADVTMSVCTGAFVLARAGLLDGKAATTHHDFYDSFAREFPRVELRRGLRFVEGGPRIATAGGLTSGIDMALRVVARYFGPEVAQATADYMEHAGQGWITS